MQTQARTPELELQHDELARAVLIASRNHVCQVRKGTSVPYISHLLQVAGLVLEFGGDLVQAAAGALHDVVEDTELSIGSLRLIMGDDVAEIVAACTDTDEADTVAAPSSADGAGEASSGSKAKAPWMARKTRYLKKLETVDPRAALVIACDKLHNLRSQISDLTHGGATVKFNASFEERRWLQSRTLEALRPKLPPRLFAELATATRDWEQLHDFLPRKAAS